MSTADIIVVVWFGALSAGFAYTTGYMRGRRDESASVVSEVTLGKAVIDGMNDVVLFGRCAGDGVKIEHNLTFKRCADGRRFKATITETAA